ncbi:S1 RNA-binding domain-containing protein [Streptomyces sp. NPDC048637]|uniref:S1 RNA-binding domain-containing protein n=1 Tax=Streptomyces sp. NPDC048637 TaxID=3155636 RepID=UPI00342BFD60
MEFRNKPDQIQPGDICKGIVTGIMDFGVYVDLGDAEGLIDRLEISWKRQEDVSKILRAGQDVTVQVLDTEVKHGAIRLSLKALIPDPMLEFAQDKLGETIPVRVSRIGPIGVFAEVADGLSGLIFPRLPETDPDDPQRRLQVGDDFLVTVLRVNVYNRQIVLSLT